MEEQKALLDSHIVKLGSHLSMQSQTTPSRNTVSSVTRIANTVLERKRLIFKNNNIRNAYVNKTMSKYTKLR